MVAHSPPPFNSFPRSAWECEGGRSSVPNLFLSPRQGVKCSTRAGLPRPRPLCQRSVLHECRGSASHPLPSPPVDCRSVAAGEPCGLPNRYLYAERTTCIPTQSVGTRRDVSPLDTPLPRKQTPPPRRSISDPVNDHPTADPGHACVPRDSLTPTTAAAARGTCTVPARR